MLAVPASPRCIAFVAAIAVHVGVLAVLLRLQPTPTLQPAPEPLLVQWIGPEPIKRSTPPRPPQQQQAAPRPKLPIVPAARPAPAPTLVATESAAIAERPAAAPAAAAPVPEPAQAGLAPAPGDTTASARSVDAAPPLPVTPPSFNAAYLNNPPPAYPALSRRMGETGRVVLSVLVTPRGAPERVELRTSSGSERLDSAALQAVQRWRFVPARQGDTPVPAWVLVPIVFSLKG